MNEPRWYTDKKNLLWIFGIVCIFFVGFFVYSFFLPECYKWIRETISFLGGIASLAGILLALLQSINTIRDVDKVRGIADAAKQASEDTQKAVRKTLSIVQVTKYCEQIKRIQEYLSNGDLKLTIHLIQEIQDAIIELKNHITNLNLNISEETVSCHIQKMGINISHIRKALETNSDKYKKEAIHQDFDDLLTILLDLKAQLTQ